MRDSDKATRLLERFFTEEFDIRQMLLELAIREGEAFKHPDTGKWHDRSGLGFDSYEDLVKYGDMFIMDRPFELR